jgi:hypothetical protein
VISWNTTIDTAYGGPFLSDDEIDVVRAWIDGGAAR